MIFFFVALFEPCEDSVGVNQARIYGDAVGIFRFAQGVVSILFCMSFSPAVGADPVGWGSNNMSWQNVATR